jgi:hypothetical protein
MSALLAGMALMLCAVGVWTWRSLEDLVPDSLPDHQYYRRRRVYRRGAVACVAVALLFLTFALRQLLGA